jgi:hypothetical protein
MRSADVNRVLWEVQNLRDELVLAMAERVKMERILREVVREPANRATVFGGSGHGRHMPTYLSMRDVLGDLEAMRRLAYLILPGRKNRIKPDVLLGRYHDRAAAVQALIARLEALEEGARQAGIDLGVLPKEY